MARSLPSDWAELEAPSIAEIDALARRAFDRLPDEFKTLAADVVIRVQDLAPEDVLEALGIEDALELMGLFQGVALAQQVSGGTGQLPNMVFLYRRAILDYWSDHHETLGAIVTHVLVHEIGHHFGLSDADMAKIERRARR
jgi:predicted Zn-dependent protease with MMP-like domain